ncbi:GNAT family N-acetyltransferase [Rhodovulum sulfidophilum]|uniref:GNAT family N-acetyltransferase n=1 Tax=Rhodovulum sulfidophilum TaxID=35806 RepID=UPI0015C0FA9D|nr:GNAT family N-acetyltransferase [Rhodovulum sulfidophilum]
MTAPYRLPDEFETDCYHLRRVNLDDAQAIFDSYATDAEVTRFLGWTPHQSVAETTAFLKIAAAEWDSGKGFPLVAFDRRQPAELVGMFHPHLIGHRVSYGYVLRGLCCTNSVGDSSRESRVVAGMHEQTHTPDLQDQELAGLQ